MPKNSLLGVIKDPTSIKSPQDIKKADTVIGKNKPLKQAKNAKPVKKMSMPKPLKGLRK